MTDNSTETDTYEGKLSENSTETDTYEGNLPFPQPGGTSLPRLREQLVTICICFCTIFCLCLSLCSPSLGREVPPGWGNCRFSSYVSVSVLFSVNICPSVLSAWAGKYRQVGRTVGNNITYCSPLSGGAISWCQCGHRKSFQEVSLCRSQARINTEGN